MLIRLVGAESDLRLLLRQSPNGEGVWKDCRFSLDATVCDACVVFEGFSDAFEVSCPAENTLFFAAEPPAVRSYNPRFLAQFHQVISCQPSMSHPRVRLMAPGLPWHLGLHGSPLGHFPLYEDFQTLDGDNKPHHLSVICSDKAFTPGHRKRLAMVRALKEILGDQLDFYGRGIRDIQDKWEAIVPYRYHIAIENSEVEHYWTEKLADSFLGGAFPFYIGAPNIHAYFEPSSLCLLPSGSPVEAADIIREAIENNVAEQSKAARKRARDLVLNAYNALELASQTLSRTTTLCQHQVFQPEPLPRATLLSRVKNRAKLMLGVRPPE